MRSFGAPPTRDAWKTCACGTCEAKRRELELARVTCIESHAASVRELRDCYEFVCPHCRKTVTVGASSSGDSVILHRLPECEMFRALSARDYLRAVRNGESRVA